MIKREGAVSSDNLNSVLMEAKSKKTAFHSILLEKGYISEDKLLSFLSSLSGIPFINLKETPVDDKAASLVPVRFAWHYEFMPLKLEGKLMTIAVNCPLSIREEDEIRLTLGFDISLVLAKKEQILELLNRYYGLGADTVDKLVGSPSGSKEAVSQKEDIDDIEHLAQEASVVKLVNQIILEAYRRRATDIHIEPFRGKARLRYRIDGILYDQPIPEGLRYLSATILSRIKIMANLNIVEHRIPQDGRATVKIQGKVLDLRISFIPTAYGESVVIRILPTKMFFSLEKLGLKNKERLAVESLIIRPSGIIFITGPTGSGKTTTLYACLEKINKSEKKVLTIEDPVEYEMGDIVQIQVNPEVGLTFSKGLRSMLRHDPDIMMVGEVRDKETAEIAIRVALTGHLVFSTLHTNDAATGITRLVDIGIEPYLVSSSVQAFIAQRLIRTICPYCKKEDTDIDARIKRDIIKSLHLGFDEEIKVYKGTGCEKCNSTGFYGRTGIYEVLLVSEEIKRLIINKASAQEIRKQAEKEGMDTLLHSGWQKVIEGITTPGEVLRACQDSNLLLEHNEDSMQIEGPDDSDKPVEKESTAKAVNEKRIYRRIPKRVTLRYRIIEKGPGRVIKMKSPKAGSSDYFNTLPEFSEEIAEGALSEGFREAVTTTVNIGAGGLVFESEYAFPLGSIAEIRIDLPKNLPPVKCLAKIVRIEHDFPRGFDIAVCFLDLLAGDRKTLDSFVKQQVKRGEILNLSLFDKKR